jgi:hypothetical protein
VKRKRNGCRYRNREKGTADYDHDNDNDHEMHGKPVKNR